MTLRVAIIIGIAVSCQVPAVQAFDQDPDEIAIQAAREALQGRSNVPWYDRSTDSVRRIDVEPLGDETQRDSNWNRQDQTESDKTETSSRRGSSELWALLLRALAWSLLAVVLTAVVLFLASAALRIDGGERTSPNVFRQGDADRVENLPFAVPSAEGDLLAATKRSYDSEDFDNAITYLFSYKLVEMDRSHLIRLARGKTNRQYLRELRSHPELRSIMTRTMLAFEEVFFGHHPLSRRRFDECWQQLDKFHGLVRQDTT
jgi:hypothetical protein